VSASFPAGRDQLAGLGVAHLFQAGEDLLPVHQHRQLTLFGTPFNRYDGSLDIFFQLCGQTGRQLLLASGGAVLNNHLHQHNSFHSSSAWQQ
jgi:hypothetical protein